MHRRFNFPVATTSPKQLPTSTNQSRLGEPFGAPSVDGEGEAHDTAIHDTAIHDTGIHDTDVTIDRIFLNGLNQGKSAAWQQLLEIWSPRLYSYAFYNTYTIGDAQALLQRTFTLVMQRVIHSTFRLQHLSQLTVLLVSTLYRLILHYQQRFGNPLFDAHRHQQPVDPLQQKFMGTLQQLTPAVQQMLLLRYLVSLSVGELALITGYGIAAVVAILRAASLHFPPATFG